jgi:hypothetical protein
VLSAFSAIESPGLSGSGFAEVLPSLPADPDPFDAEPSPANEGVDRALSVPAVALCGAEPGPMRSERGCAAEYSIRESGAFARLRAIRVLALSRGALGK